MAQIFILLAWLENYYANLSEILQCPDKGNLKLRTITGWETVFRRKFSLLPLDCPLKKTVISFLKKQQKTGIKACNEL